MGHETCATVSIQGQPSEGNPSGIVVINESDFDEATMVKAKEPEPVAATEPLKPTPVASGKPAKAVAPWAA